MRTFFRAAAVAISLVIVLGVAPATFAKGRPMRATYTRTSCFDGSVDVTWWKKLDVRGVKVDLYTDELNWLGAIGWSDPAGLDSPLTLRLEGGAGANSMYVVVSIYSVTDLFPSVGPAPTPLDSYRTAPVTFDCF
jgi:hypothetical protein